MTVQITSGDTIRVNYVGTLDDGEIFDSSEDHNPLTFTVGSGQTIDGFDQAVIGMQVGETRTITIQPEDAYGIKDDRYIVQVPKAALDENFSAELGKQVDLQTPNGHWIPGIITAVGPDDVTVDINHPLAGKALTFTITVVETGLEPEEHHHCGCGHSHDDECDDHECQCEADHDDEDHHHDGGCGCGHKH